MKGGRNGQPIVQLQTVMMPTKDYGPVPRPAFKVSRWDDGAVGTPAETSVAPKLHSKDEIDEQMNDGILF